MRTYFVVTALTVGLLVPMQAAHTQTTFAWPDTKVDLKGYQYLENCVAFGGRTRDSVRLSPDTALSFQRKPISGAPDVIRASLQECLSAFTPTQIPRDYTIMAQQAYLQAGLVTEADAAVRHGLSLITKTDTSSRTALIDSAIEKYAKTPPFQLNLARTWIDTLERYGSAYRPWNLFRNYFWLMYAAYSEGDDSLAVKMGRRVLELAPAATKTAKGAELAFASLSIGSAIRITQERELLDSLRKGTAAYAAVYAAHLRRAIGGVSSEQIQGAKAAVLSGDYWFPSTAATQEYPRKGRPSLLVFVRPQMDAGDFQLLHALRWLTQKYPTVDLIFVTSTMGSFGPLEPQPPEREAFLADSVFRNFHRLNPITTVTKGTFVQFDAPDNRRFYQPYPNFDAYPPAGGDLYVNGKIGRIYLIDEDRKIVDRLSVSPIECDLTAHLIETLLARITAGPHQ